ncbi:hypothetical protein JF66_07875 [Cryobacterium sp. MLB-32]|uniref:hypothetical protein n=2 Tax=Cryobacterium sp. MLB-32 TaxID=1529318 RepID=UPI0004E668D0|nr:hypothetical protein [Cryobacterium sp. MLB-32]KFF59955.1 hypothetical protein JF66_07875 [Cryobacterium sp. MLB-32]
MRHHSLWAAAAVATLLSVALAGCAVNAPPKAAGTPTVEAVDFTGSPLMDYIGELFPEYNEQAEAARSATVSAAVVACMAAAGFDYIPDDPQADLSTFSESLDEDEWTAIHGYGMIPTLEDLTLDDEYIDPNRGYLDTLGYEREQAYSDTLHGQWILLAPNEDGSEQPALDGTGCIDMAEAATPPLEDARVTAVVDAAWGHVDSSSEGVESSVEMHALEVPWSTCLVDAGFPLFATRADAPASFEEQANAVYATASGPDAVLPDAATLDALRGPEITQAVADLECIREVDFDQKALETTFALESRYVQEHKAELDVLLADFVATQ